VDIKTIQLLSIKEAANYEKQDIYIIGQIGRRPNGAEMTSNKRKLDGL